MCHNFFPQKKSEDVKKRCSNTLSTLLTSSQATHTHHYHERPVEDESLWFFWPGFCRRKREKKSDILNLQEPRFELKKCSKTLWEKAMHTISYKENLVFGMLYMCYYGPGISPWQHPSMHYISTQLNMAIKHTFQQKLGTYLIMVVNIFCKSS